ncbi:MAG TPA: metal ABC transporter permease [Candidatus Mcinerneyibacteriales bacterium]|nr:metal ABC transporter permease [Candidatus Mcinerneyibacteriales bacterium]HPJ69883.1 metal ABC transporter permease [Candidatus Mcinerneyibacteriales bacterium]HPQ89064.1 metal ABC transporter permease [Candidatus Mcinerneyibacteriales bacterium]
MDSVIPLYLFTFTAALLSGIAAGIAGTFVVTRRLAVMSGGLAHAVLGGIGLAVFLSFEPLWGALAAALLFVLILVLGKNRLGEREDTVIAALWSLGMALGVLFISLTPGYTVDLLSYLFGNILLVTVKNLFALAILDLFLILGVVLFKKHILYVSFDEEYSAMRGLPVNLMSLLFLGVIAVTIVLLTRIVGLVLVIALLALPASAANLFSRHLTSMMILASLFAVLFNSAGLGISYLLNLPSGAMIIIVSAAGYGAARAVRALMKRKREAPEG